MHVSAAVFLACVLRVVCLLYITIPCVCASSVCLLCSLLVFGELLVSTMFLALGEFSVSVVFLVFCEFCVCAVFFVFLCMCLLCSLIVFAESVHVFAVFLEFGEFSVTVFLSL